MKRLLFPLAMLALTACQPEPVANRLHDNLDGTITDQETGLTWMRCDVGQTWNGHSCSDHTNRYTWSDAYSAGQGVNFAGYQDWRLPTVRELFSLVVCSSGKMGKYTTDLKDGHAALKDGCLGNYTKPTIDTRAFPNTDNLGGYWSSSGMVGYTDRVWFVDFFNGTTDWTGKGASGNVRLVRSEL